MVTKEDSIIIKTESHLKRLLHMYHNGPSFAMAFIFDSDELYECFFDGIGISVDMFKEKYYYFNQEKNIHIANFYQNNAKNTR